MLQNLQNLGSLGLHKSFGKAFLPSDLSNLILWFKADTDVYQESTFTTASGNGDVVGGWKDQSTEAKHITQTTTASKPLLRTNQFNGLPAIEFDGTDDFLKQATPTSITQGTFFIVCASDDTQTGYAFSWNNVQGVAYIYNVGNEDIYSDATINTISDTGTATNLITVAVSTTEYNVWVDGAADAGNPTSITNPTFDGANKLEVGANGAGGQNFKGKIAEIVAYSTVLSTADRQSVEAYLADRYSITLA